jgi:ADP-dependent NAD(P)H-hydrate dehydratase / NAD(P)H-hydrate epimerase
MPAPRPPLCRKMTQHRPVPDSLRDVYSRAAVALPTAAEAAAADRAAREQYGVPERVLMESAGRAAALVLQRLYPTGLVVGVAGSGNNGGDLLVMLRALQAWGREVAIIAVGARPPAEHLAHGDALRMVSDDADALPLLARAGVVVDGMLGTGSEGVPRGRVAEWIGRLNAAGAPVLALDLPSGVDATTGAVPADAVNAAVTVSFGWPKLGLLLHPARRHCGRLVAVEIAFPTTCLHTAARAITPDMVRACMTARARAPDAHKGTAGRLLVLAGSTGMAGAAALAVEAALRAGAGLVRVASSTTNRTVLQTLVPEATFLDRDSLQAQDLEPMHALVAGPGLGTDGPASDSLRRALEMMPGRPTLLDADALNMLAEQGGELERVAASRPVVATPHARELSRLTGADLAEIVADPIAAARGAAHRFGVHLLLKGQPSIIAAPDGTLLVNSTGSSDVAAAGMGDQLAGTIGALLAAGYSIGDAAAVGLFLSARAADLAALGHSLTPRDVSQHLALAMAAPGPVESDLGLPFVTFDQPPRW